MKRKLVLFLLFACLPAHICCAQKQSKTDQSRIILPAGLTAEEVADGWIALFDDKTDFGWKAESNVNWSFAKGVISADRGDVGLLRTTSQFDDFVLRLEYLATEKTNSGVFIHTSPRPRNPASDCYEINIAPADNPFPTGSLVARKKSKQSRFTKGWHSLEITANGPEIVVKRDGKTVCEYRDSRPLGRGYIGLQFNAGKTSFRKVRLKPLGTKKLFAGKDLARWKEYPALKGKFSVRDNELQVIDGPGQLESKELFGDFVFQMQCRTNGENLNSGIFFRCIPGERMNGYESQIQNGIQVNDPTRPVDCGTGGIFRRQNARRVNADDKKWFAMTIVAVGPHFSVWVNGYQVSDWTDQRKKDKNPRHGLRLQAGTIMIQAHDPTTDLSFREIQAGEIEVRRPKQK